MPTETKKSTAKASRNGSTSAPTWWLSGDSLTIAAGASTLALCPDLDYGTIDYGTIFANSLTEAATYAVTNDTLTITLNKAGTAASNLNGNITWASPAPKQGPSQDVVNIAAAPL
jgi:heat shock protein HslJ